MLLEATNSSANTVSAALQFIGGIRPFVELLSLLSTIALSLIALYGLRQIRLLKTDIVLRNERASKEKAIEASRDFLEDFIGSYDKLYQEAESKKLPSYKGPIANFCAKKEFSKDAWGKALDRMRLASFLPAFNILEGIAATFTTGVADEKVGFDIFGLSFVSSVSSYYDVLSCCRILADDKGQDYFRNTVTLFQTWSPRVTAKELEIARNQLDQRLSTLEQPRIKGMAADL